MHVHNIDIGNHGNPMAEYAAIFTVASELILAKADRVVEIRTVSP